MAHISEQFSSMDFIMLGTSNTEMICQFIDQAQKPQDDDYDTDLETASQSSMDINFTDDIPVIGSEIFECPCTQSSIHKTDFIILECGCVRCQPCLQIEVDVGLERKSWPPQCIECRAPFTLTRIHQNIRPDQFSTWQDVKDEYNNPDPRYCAAPDCGHYLPISKTDERWLVCRKCEMRTCSDCRTLKSWHKDGKECPMSSEADSLEEMRRSGFMPCPWCKQMIERLDGCDHMSCETCGKNFCYRCGKKKGRSELPCNCRGDNPWIEDDLEEMDPETQQDILDRIENGLEMPAGINVLRDIELLGLGPFRGVGQRVGEAVNQHEPIAPVEIRPQVVGFNHWEAQAQVAADGRNRDLNFLGRRLGGRRLGDENDHRLNIANEQDDEWNAPDPRPLMPRIANDYAFRGPGNRIGDQIEQRIPALADGGIEVQTRFGTGRRDLRAEDDGSDSGQDDGNTHEFGARGSAHYSYNFSRQHGQGHVLGD